MNDATSKPVAGRAQAPSGGKTYRRPQLKTFGKLHLRTHGASGNGGDGQSGMSKPNAGRLSDRRAKENIVRIGDHPAGIGLYLFDYKPEFRDAWGHGRQLGVMADEVEQVMPIAVSVRADGYRTVDYGMLGFARAAQ